MNSGTTNTPLSLRTEGNPRHRLAHSQQSLERKVATPHQRIHDLFAVLIEYINMNQHFSQAFKVEVSNILCTQTGVGVEFKRHTHTHTKILEGAGVGNLKVGNLKAPLPQFFTTLWPYRSFTKV